MRIIRAILYILWVIVLGFGIIRGDTMQQIVALLWMIFCHLHLKEWDGKNR